MARQIERVRPIVSIARDCYSDGVTNQPPETLRVSHRRVVCDGASDIPNGAALGHPRVWLEIDETGFVECGYCDRRFVLAGGPADRADAA